MIQLRHILVGILIFAVSTLWVRERWALSCLEGGTFLASAWLLLPIALRWRAAACGSTLPLILVGMGLWGVVQLAARWTAVASATSEAVLYWLAAASLVWLGQVAGDTREKRLRCLKAALTAGSAVCLLGLIQLFTSDGRVFWLFPSGYDSEVIGPFVSRNNYAAFVELLLPVALALVFKDRRNSRAYLVVAAILAASVIASGSRAGSAIVIAETAIAFLLLLRRAERGIGRRYWITFAMLASAFTLIVGYQYLWERFSDDRDPYAVRREFLKSSLAMVRAQPLHGFGLGTWTSAYPQFAVVDTGEVANHAHNEWVQWTAEGGLPALILMLVVFAWAVRPAFQSIWGIGIIAVFCHSWVDYPFIHLGLAAWIFVLLGLLAAYRRECRDVDRPRAPAPIRTWLPIRLLAGASIPVLAFGTLLVSKLAWADMLYRGSTLENVRRAAALCPDRAEYEFALAQLAPLQAVKHLERGLMLDPYLTKARLSLATELEMTGRNSDSEGQLLEAARRDRQFAASWALANFYFRNNRPEPFWYWARRAAVISYGNLAPLFDLCFLVTDDVQTVLDRVVVLRRPVELQFLSYLLEHGRIPNAQPVASRIAGAPRAEDRDVLLSYVDRALDAGRGIEARQVWNSMSRARLLPYGPAEIAGIVNGDFSQPILSRGFDWRLPAIEGISVAGFREGGPALEVTFSGKQPEACEFLSQAVPVRTGAEYVLHFEYRTAGIPAATGLFCSVGPDAELALAAADAWTPAEWRFAAPSDVTRVVFAYHRTPGTTRIEGALSLRRVRISNP